MSKGKRTKDRAGMLSHLFTSFELSVSLTFLISIPETYKVVICEMESHRYIDEG